jgi:hypothetical protein
MRDKIGSSLTHEPAPSNDPSQRETAIEHLRLQMAFAKDTGPKDASFLNSVIARNVLDEDLGRFDSTLHMYRLDDDTRDRLIVHARQDAAHAVINTATLLQEVKSLRRGVRIMLVLMIIIASCSAIWPFLAR